MTKTQTQYVYVARWTTENEVEALRADGVHNDSGLDIINSSSSVFVAKSLGSLKEKFLEAAFVAFVEFAELVGDDDPPVKSIKDLRMVVTKIDPNRSHWVACTRAEDVLAWAVVNRVKLEG